MSKNVVCVWTPVVSSLATFAATFSTRFQANIVSLYCIVIWLCTAADDRQCCPDKSLRLWPTAMAAADEFWAGRAQRHYIASDHRRPPDNTNSFKRPIKRRPILQIIMCTHIILRAFSSSLLQCSTIYTKHCGMAQPRQHNTHDRLNQCCPDGGIDFVGCNFSCCHNRMQCANASAEWRTAK